MERSVLEPGNIARNLRVQDLNGILKSSPRPHVRLFTGKLSKQVVAGGFQNKWMANAFKTSEWPMLLLLAEANAFNASETYHEFPK